MFVRGLADAEQPPLQALEDFLLERGWPDDLKFEAAFATFPLYSRGYTKEVIETLERGRGHKEPADLTDAQVEHIMPQTLSDAWRTDLGPNAEKTHAQWLDCPGNLTLSAYNQELWNHKFAIKREHYAESNVVLTRELADYETWGEDEIKSRGEALAKEAAQIWVGPAKAPHAESAEATEGNDETRFEVRRKFWEGLNDCLLNDYPALPKFEAKPVWTVRLPSSIRHIGIETRLGLRNGVIGIDIWFWRDESMPLWQKIRSAPESYNELVGATWSFEQIKDRPRARMSIELPMASIRDPASWQSAYEWFGPKLALIYDKLFPVLREEMDDLPVS
jgi:hypothetical protein